MTLTWPWALLGLLLVPVVVTGFRRLLRRQEERRGELARQGLVVSVPPRDRWARLAPALLVAALVVLVVAMTRPVAAVAEPRREGTVVLAFDVSTSMSATDIKPTRLEAAKAAARQFIEAAAVRSARRRRLRRHRARHGAPDDGQGGRARRGQPA